MSTQRQPALFDAEQRFHLAAATKDRLECLHRKMQSAYAHYLKERLEPVCERYRRAVASRSGGRGASYLRSLSGSPPGGPNDQFLKVQASFADYRERHRWPFVFAYHRRAYRDYGLAGLLWFMQRLHRGMKPRKLSAVILLMMSRADDPTPGEIMRWVRRLYGEGLVINPTTKKPGRRALGPTAMTPAECQRRHRARKQGRIGIQPPSASILRPE